MAELPDVLRSAEVLLDVGEERLAARLLDEHVRSRLLSSLNDAEHLLRSLEAMLRVSGKLNQDLTRYQGPSQIW
jgi:hypothetical protein